MKFEANLGKMATSESGRKYFCGAFINVVLKI